MGALVTVSAPDAWPAVVTAVQLSQVSQALHVSCLAEDKSYQVWFQMKIVLFADTHMRSCYTFRHFAPF